MDAYVIDWDKAGESVVDLSGFLDGPAGKDGFVKVEGGRLVTAGGKRLRMWGVNVTGGVCFPEKKQAVLLADDFARLGFNCVRFHHMDASWVDNIFDEKFDDTQHLDAEAFDRFDFFVSELKKRGIYSVLNLNVHRHFKAGDGVRDWEKLGIGKGATYFNERLIELQLKTARQLLTHANGDTGNEYRHEPAVAVIELVNENSLIEAWVQGRLDGGREDERASTFSPLPKSYAEELTDQWNEWLVGNVEGAAVARWKREAGVAEDGVLPRLKNNGWWKVGDERYRAELRFLMALEQRFFERMKDLLVGELKVNPLLVGDADHNDWITGFPHQQGNLMFDVMDGHGYWEHPNLGEKFSIKNTPMVNDPLDSTVVQFSRTPVAGRPFTVSETNQPWPHRYACEGIPVMTVYSMLQGWDGIEWFEYGEGRLRDVAKEGIRNPFGIANDPVKYVALVVCGLMWHRRDVAPGRGLVERRVTRELLERSVKVDTRVERPFFTPGFAKGTALVSRTRVVYGEGEAGGYGEEVALGVIESDTGELGWYGADVGRGIVVIDTPRAQGVVGFVGGTEEETGNVVVEVENDFCALMVVSLDGEDIASSGRLLVTATARAGNRGMAWEEDGTTLKSWGEGPVEVEVVKGVVRLRGIASAKAMHVQGLAAEGRRQGDVRVVAASGDGEWDLEIGGEVALWTVVDVER